MSKLIDADEAQNKLVEKAAEWQKINRDEVGDDNN